MNTASFNKYLMTDAKEKILFSDALFFFDASALLEFYYYSNNTKNEIFEKVFKRLRNRLVITSQTEFEFLKNRNKIILKPIESYKNLIEKSKTSNDSGHIEEIQKALVSLKDMFSKNIQGQFQALNEKTSKLDKHPFLDHGIFLEFEKSSKKG